MNETKSFGDFGVDERIIAALSDAEITAPFPIQELTLPLALSGADLIGQARTGTGKTLAFGIPLLQQVDPADRRVQALVVVPTRELCLQVRGDLQQAGARKGVDVVAVYGGKAIDAQSEAIAGGAPIVVGTPGRLLDLKRRGILDLSSAAALVLDEADEMLDLGFLPDVQQLIEACAETRQTMLFSATMPAAVVALARRYMTQPTFLRAEVEEVRVAPETDQYFFSCHRMDKPAVLARILQTPNRGLCVVFTSTKRMADVLAEELRGRGIAAAPIHSDLRQDARERTLQRFRTGAIDVLVATEVAARGLDIDDVTHVVNYDCPDDEKMYLHRIGRTGRAGAAGVAITLAMWNELARVEMIKRALDISAETHEVFSTSPILDELFDLPEREPRKPVEAAPAAGPASAGRRAPKPPAPPRPRAGGRRAPASSAARAPAARVDAAEEETAEEGTAAQAAPGSPAPQRGRLRRRRRSRTDSAPERAGEPQDEQPPRPEPLAPRAPQRAPQPAVGAPGSPETSIEEPVATRRAQAEPSVRRVRSRQRARPRGGVPTSDTPPAKADERRTGSRRRPTSAQAEPTGRRRGKTSEPGRSRDRARSDRGRSGPRAPRPAAATADVEEARGGGKPALRRPLVVQHLP